MKMKKVHFFEYKDNNYNKVEEFTYLYDQNEY